jgi:hypothetical protein
MGGSWWSIGTGGTWCKMMKNRRKWDFDLIFHHFPPNATPTWQLVEYWNVFHQMPHGNIFHQMPPQRGSWWNIGTFSTKCHMAVGGIFFHQMPPKRGSWWSIGTFSTKCHVAVGGKFFTKCHPNVAVGGVLERFPLIFHQMPRSVSLIFFSPNATSTWHLV